VTRSSSTCFSRRSRSEYTCWSECNIRLWCLSGIERGALTFLGWIQHSWVAGSGSHDWSRASVAKSGASRAKQGFSALHARREGARLGLRPNLRRKRSASSPEGFVVGGKGIEAIAAQGVSAVLRKRFKQHADVRSHAQLIITRGGT
jgi:hypothetical protein